MILPVAQGDVSLGQHEMVEGVLNVDLHVTVAQYVASVYTTTPLASRANAVYSAITDVWGRRLAGESDRKHRRRVCWCIARSLHGARSGMARRSHDDSVTALASPSTVTGTSVSDRKPRGLWLVVPGCARAFLNPVVAPSLSVSFFLRELVDALM